MLGVVFIMAMTWICVVGIELSARMQMVLLGHRARGPRPVQRRGARQGLRRRHPRRGSSDAVVAGAHPFRRGQRAFPRASCSRCSSTGAGTPRSASTRSVRTRTARRASPACCRPSSSSPSTSSSRFSAQAVKGADFLPTNSADVLSATGKIVFGGSGLGHVVLKLLIIAVLSSSAASCQTTILPAARTRSRWRCTGPFPPSSARSIPGT